VEISQDYEDLFKTLNTYKIRYLIVGAHALKTEGIIRLNFGGRPVVPTKLDIQSK